MKSSTEKYKIVNPRKIEEATSAKRIGSRIRDIRTAKNLTQAQLGEFVGLTADRIHRYENGIRKPKTELLDNIAHALGVEILALTDPVPSYELGIMYAFFEMEKYFKLRVLREDGCLKLVFGDGKPYSEKINEYLDKWERIMTETNSAIIKASSKEERDKAIYNYNMWEWGFPRSMEEQPNYNNSNRKALILEEINRLEKMLNEETSEE